MKEYNEYLNRYAKDYTNGDTAIAGKHAIVRSVKEYMEEMYGQGVAMLINSDIFCEKELQKEAITKHGILITSTLISECLEE